MPKPLLLTLACLFAFTSCENDRKVKTPAQVAREQAAKRAQAQKQNPPEAVGEYGYRFEGRNSAGTACGTGTQNFRSIALMCIGIQDPSLNADCALSERRAKFDRECKPAFQFHEALSCRFAVFRGAPDLSANGDIDPKRALQYGEYCAGRGRGGMPMPGLTINEGHLVEDIHLDLQLAFVPTGKTTEEHRSGFKLSLFRKDASGARSKLAGDFIYTGGEKAHEEKLGDTSYSYAVRCENVCGCGK